MGCSEVLRRAAPSIARTAPKPRAAELQRGHYWSAHPGFATQPRAQGVDRASARRARAREGEAAACLFLRPSASLCLKAIAASSSPCLISRACGEGCD